MVREIGMDLFRAEKLARDINYRRLLNIALLYAIIALLAICIVLMIIYKVKHSWLIYGCWTVFTAPFHYFMKASGHLAHHVAPGNSTAPLP